ncbi:hypothetical protein MKZ38_005394 [Zalerion maritima]|uniref:Trafficking protein particle complex subunit 10 n=1 Tax=Zalerion maritima TaxID=339359 RepID=A0AAD5RKT6_9PEZI|nr:hypothetical protein MKZ38_005394 [Zalerion maritima]
MEQPFSTSKVTVEFFDPHQVYKLIEPGLIPRLPLKNLHWQSHAGPLRSIDTLHVELVESGSDATPPTTANPLQRTDSVASRDDGFQTQTVGGRAGSVEPAEATAAPARPAARKQRHQIPGLRRTPYLKVLFVRIDDNDSYKSTVRAEIKEWVKAHTPGKDSLKKSSKQEKHDAFEWLIVHVVIPNTVASTQPRISRSETSTGEKSSASIWKSSSSTIWERLRTDFNKSSSVDRVSQIRIGINDVPYDILPRVVPAVPSGYQETPEDTKNAWQDLVNKLKSQILSSFDMRVTQYEEDIKEKDSQRPLPGWNFCTFFMLKEGLARGFESVGLVDDALVGYDELTVGLDSVVQEQAIAGSAEEHGGALLPFTDDLKKVAEGALASLSENGDVEAVDLEGHDDEAVNEIAISSTKKPYRDMILANNVSVFDFRCYIFSRQISLLLRLGNAWSTQEELLAKLKEQQESVLHGVAPRHPPPSTAEDPEKLDMLAEICRRTLEFIPALSQVMRKDIMCAMAEEQEASKGEEQKPTALVPILLEVIDNIVASFAFSVAQQILAQTSTKALPIPPSTLAPNDGQEQKSSIPEPKTMMHPARHSSLNPRPQSRQPPSPGVFPGPGAPELPKQASQFMKPGLEDLAARRAELYALSRNILEERGRERNWNGGWPDVPVLGAASLEDLQDVNLHGDQSGERGEEKGGDETDAEGSDKENGVEERAPCIAGLGNRLIKTALDSKEDFYRLYETLTDKALRHYTIASHNHSVQGHMADLAVLKFHLGDFNSAAAYFYQATPFFGEYCWSLLELSMLCMYAKCLKELDRHDEYVRAVLKLLSKAASAERERLEERSSLRLGPGVHDEYPESLAVKGFLDDILPIAKSITNQEFRVPLAKFLYSMEIQGSPEYHDQKDSFSLSLKLRSLIPDDLPIEKAKIRLSGPREIWVETTDVKVIKPGMNTIKLDSCVIVPGNYNIDRVHFYTSNLILHFEKDANSAPHQSSELLKNPHVVLFQRANALDISLGATRQLTLDKNTNLDLVLRSGWNQIKSCEIRVRAATGGLRLLMHEARIVGSSIGFTKPPDHAIFSFGEMSRDTAVTIRFPITLESDVPYVSVKVEVFFATEHGSFTFAKTPTVPIALALGVNVQDVFKHKALFSKFTVSTATNSPMRLFTSELIQSDAYDSSFGLPPDGPVLIFPKQPASLLYKIRRKPNSVIGPKTKKTMYLKLLYSVLQQEIDNQIEETLFGDLKETNLGPYSRPLLATVLSHVHASLTGHDLERASLMGELPTGFLADIRWARFFTGIGNVLGTHDDAASKIAEFILGWQRKHSQLEIPTPDEDSSCVREILIAVDIPPITIVHTADIRLQSPAKPHGVAVPPGAAEVVSMNQLLPAVLHLRWTRLWDTTGRPPQDLEFSYEVTAPAENWLVGGRRKGHFVIPGVDPDDRDAEVPLESTPDTEADIPLLLSPLREGWLPYPQVDIREVKSEDGSGIVVASHGHCETDFRNLGETVRVVQDRERVTLSLDSSGPGGGPLILDSETRESEGRVLL